MCSTRPRFWVCHGAPTGSIPWGPAAKPFLMYHQATKRHSCCVGYLDHVNENEARVISTNAWIMRLNAVGFPRGNTQDNILRGTRQRPIDRRRTQCLYSSWPVLITTIDVEFNLSPITPSSRHRNSVAIHRRRAALFGAVLRPAQMLLPYGCCGCN